MICNGEQLETIHTYTHNIHTYIHTMEYYTVFKMNEEASYIWIWDELQDILWSEKH